jgi:hypothetical protein
MIINSLNIEYNNELIITDVDDCLMFTSKSIRKHNLRRKSFYMNKVINDKYKHSVYNNAELTEWGREFVDMVSNSIINRYKLITQASNRNDILCNKFNVIASNVIESMSTIDKAEYLNSLNEKIIYVDDKTRVIKQVCNDKIVFVNYPMFIARPIRRFKHNRRRP